MTAKWKDLANVQTAALHLKLTAEKKIQLTLQVIKHLHSQLEATRVERKEKHD